MSQFVAADVGARKRDKDEQDAEDGAAGSGDRGGGGGSARLVLEPEHTCSSTGRCACLAVRLGPMEVRIEAMCRRAGRSRERAWAARYVFTSQRFCWCFGSASGFKSKCRLQVRCGPVLGPLKLALLCVRELHRLGYECAAGEAAPSEVAVNVSMATAASETDGSD